MTADIFKDVTTKLEENIIKMFPFKVTSTYFDYMVSSEIMDALEEYDLDRKECTQFFTKIKQHLSTYAKDKGVIR